MGVLEVGFGQSMRNCNDFMFNCSILTTSLCHAQIFSAGVRISKSPTWSTLSSLRISTASLSLLTW